MLIATTIFHLALLVVSIAGMLLDPRLITGVPAWLKPSKFAISSAIYAVTLAWIIRDQPRTRLLRIGSWTVGLMLILENIIIDIQAMRGTTSHFNTSTPLDATLFGIMGFGIAALWIATVLLFIDYVRHPIADVGLGRAIRVGFFISILGAALGGFMLGPNAQQREALKTGNQHLGVGGHTVGAPDGGAGLPFTGWSTQHGDLRIAHFLGLHAIQLLPLLVLLARRRAGIDVIAERRLVAIAGTLYAILIALVLMQALAGHPLIPIGAA